MAVSKSTQHERDPGAASLHRYLIKHIPASDGAEHGAVAGAARRSASQHALLPSPLLLGVRELRGAGHGARLLLLQGFGAVQPQGAELVLGLGQAPAGRDGRLDATLLTLAQGGQGAVAERAGSL